jgi:hypothetical protein
MKNRPIQLTEQDLHMLVEDAVRAYLVNEGIDEINFKQGVKDLYNQGRAAITSLGGREDKAGNKPSLGKRFSNMRKNWQTQGQLNDLNNAIEVLYKYVNSGKLNANLTVAQLFGKDGKNGKMGQYLGNMASQISRRGGTAYNARNKQNLPQQPTQ